MSFSFGPRTNTDGVGLMSCSLALFLGGSHVGHLYFTMAAPDFPSCVWKCSHHGNLQSLTFSTLWFISTLHCLAVAVFQRGRVR